MRFKQPVTELIRQRRSVRNYIPEAFDPDTAQQVQEVLSGFTTGPMGNRVTFQLVQRDGASGGQKVKIGTYGFIKGAQHFIVGEMQRDAFAEEDYGFLLEQIMLHLLEMGLGTCWLGGTFKRDDFIKILGHSEGMFIPAVTPVGRPAASMSNRERLIRRGAGSDQRKPWKELFFEEAFDQPMQQGAGLERDNLPFEMVRLAPSASNKQPWRILRDSHGVHFFLERTPGYGGFVKNVDLQCIDMGIAMAHFELSARELGATGHWEKLNPLRSKEPGSLETRDQPIARKEGVTYIVSWVPEV